MTSKELKVLTFLTLTVILCVMVSFYKLRFGQIVSPWNSQPIQISLPVDGCDCKKCTNASDRDALRKMMHGPLDQADERLVDLILADYLIPPAPKTAPYKLVSPAKDPSMGQSAVVKKIFEGKRDGFFIECGALDGETRSNTLSLEKDWGWQGLLIEGDPSNFKLLRKKNRKAWLADCCLAINPYPHVTTFLRDFNLGQIVDPNGLRSATDSRNKTKSERQCFPIYSLLKAINIRKVDYFSLDVEGFELEVLRTIPFDQVQIDVLSVEFAHDVGGSGPLQSFMESKGYRVLTKVINKNYLANDFIFIHKSFENPTEFPSLIRT